MKLEEAYPRFKEEVDSIVGEVNKILDEDYKRTLYNLKTEQELFSLKANLSRLKKKKVSDLTTIDIEQMEALEDLLSQIQ